MASLYDFSVGSYVQLLGGVAGFLDKGLNHLTANKVDLNEVVETRLFPDMLPFRFQVQSVAHHSLGAIEALKSGTFLPPSGMEPHDYAGLQKLVADTTATLQKMKPEEVNALEGRDVFFEIRGNKLPFTAEGFIQSFSMQNFYFHATTAYDILRMKGVPLGKRDFMGRMKMKM